jgi:4a-hydroxytetrahydrobiopterin dehydratase
MTSAEIEAKLVLLHAWKVDEAGKVISKEFAFKDFAEALSFANKIGVIAAEEDHHPDLLVSWGKVGVSLSTHSVGGLSEKDFTLAARIDDLTRGL